MINKAMKEKLTKNNHDLENFKSGLNSDIGKSLSVMSKSKQLGVSPNQRNFMGEFHEVMKSSNRPTVTQEREVKNAHLKYFLQFFLSIFI
jgi:ABC-type Fe3+-citrate transport system substrate-binding protein